MEEQMIKIDVEKIMEEIRENIKERGYTNDLLSFQDIEINANAYATKFSVSELEKWMKYTNSSHRIEYYHQVIPHNSLKNNVKAIIRKCLRFLLQPLVEEQNYYNANLVKTINQMNLFIQEQIQQNEEYEDRIEMLEKKLKELDK